MHKPENRRVSGGVVNDVADVLSPVRIHDQPVIVAHVAEDAFRPRRVVARCSKTNPEHESLSTLLW